MATAINLRPIQTGDACYLTDHHNRPGECIITATMMDGAETAQAAEEQILLAMFEDDCLPYGAYGADLESVKSAAMWCAEQWSLAQADMPAAADRDNEGGDESERYLECPILATWEV